MFKIIFWKCTFKHTQDTGACNCRCCCQETSDNANVLDFKKHSFVTSFDCDRYKMLWHVVCATETQFCERWYILPAHALLIQVDQGGISRLAQLNISGGSHGTPMGLQENMLDQSFIGTDLVGGGDFHTRILFLFLFIFSWCFKMEPYKFLPRS